ncbi:helix-turn-helix transcriptional regulator [Spirosoma sp. KCTC 42546]|uniref:helix-turn-helix domain-containing protein n=1 Tax=Spirosoma sp. KCTC 42546 TaxID=2520506 RepID=UPI00115724BB|nr:AraC family transcriptional regulator [Spirosoma sp. KCTC 42546]QDK79660.1 helix-turn-helix transcriptional regulator [Spirosoma sp. KCTC 42546]
MQTLPIHLDLFALIIFLGVAQGLFLGIFFLTGGRGKNISNRCHGLFMLVLSAISGEIVLNYTNYTFRLLWLGDFSEPFNFLLGPLFYFFVFSRLWQRLPHRWAWHLVPFGVWLINSVTWMYQPIEFKYNSYINSQHPELPFIRQHIQWEDDFTGLRDLISEMTLVSCFIYAVLALLVIRKASRQGSALRSTAKLKSLLLPSWLFALVPFLIALVKPQFVNDVGDYLLATYIAITIYTNSFLVMSRSDFFRDEPPVEPKAIEPDLPAEPKKKYEKSALSEEVEDAVLTKLARLLDTEKPYLDSDLSLPKLAARLNTSPHHLSQLLNDRLGQNFFDWLATYRIAEAQRLLTDSSTAHLKIDEIAERVGYNSPSAFHTAFKRLTSQTPAQYRAKDLGDTAFRQGA